MKKQVISNVFRKTTLFIGAASFFVLSFFPAAVQAQEKSMATPPVFIKYIGSVESQPVFQIEFDNKNEQVYYLTISDQDGNYLYGEKTKEKKFTKKFKYENAGMNNVKLTFTLAGDKEKQTQVYEVNTNTRLVQDVVVTRL